MLFEFDVPVHHDPSYGLIGLEIYRINVDNGSSHLDHFFSLSWGYWHPTCITHSFIPWMLRTMNSLTKVVVTDYFELFTAVAFVVFTLN